MLPYRIIGNNGCCQTLSRYFWPTSTVVSLHNLCKQKSISHVGRENFSTQIENSNQPTFVDFNIAKLTNRSVVRIFGNDSRDFLQALITNDIRCLSNKKDDKLSHSLYSYMLNSTGRIVADIFLFNSTETDTVYLDVDTETMKLLFKYLKLFKIRRKVSFRVCDDKHIWAIYPSEPENVPKFEFQILSDQVVVTHDPRKSCFGFRMLTHNIADIQQCISIFNTNFVNHGKLILNCSDLTKYETFRYLNGIGEGVKDFGVEVCFPFETNAELLNGVSFDKGCFVGQELTARTYHTGVIRKRFMPIEIVDDNFDCNSEESLPVQNVITDNGKTMGRFRVNHNRNGLASLKHADVLVGDSSQIKLKLTNSEFYLKTWRPFWWPKF